MCGSIFFNLKEIVHNALKNNFEDVIFWKNIYGSPLGTHGGQTLIMNNNPELGSTWKGRVLMQVHVEKTEKPIIKVSDLDDKVKLIANPSMLMKEYEVMAEVGIGISLPHSGTSYKVCI